MAAPVYSYRLVSLIEGELLAEVPLSGVRFSKVLNDAGTFEGTLHLDKQLARLGIDVYDATTPCRRGVYVLRDGVPQWGGIIWTRRYDSSSQQVRIGAADWWSYFDHRKILPILPDDPAVDYVAQQSVTYEQVEQNQLVRNLIALAQSHTGGDIGVQLDESATGILRDRTYFGYELKDVGEQLQRLAGLINGPDIRFDVGRDPDGTVTRLMLLGDPRLGQSGSPHVWEYGGNLQTYTWPSDGSRMATRAFAVGDGIEQGMPIAVSEDADRYLSAWPLLEEESGYSSVTSSSVLQDHADADQQSARLPVVLPEITVRGDVPPIVGAYAPGDDARVVIRDGFHTNGLDVGMRILTQEIHPSGEQGETVKLTMAPLLEAPDIY